MVKPVRLWLSVGAAVAALGLYIAPQAAARSAARASGHAAINCAKSAALCTEVYDNWLFGRYVGHDEPSTLFYSDVPGSGNHMSYHLKLPTDPSARHPTEPGKSYAFELSGADWLGMAICDTQSDPEQRSDCPPDSDRNILDPSVSPHHVGQAYMEMQFYPPGWIPWPTWQVAVGASGCDPTQWCAALNIDSLSLNPVTGQQNNATCENQVGEEYVNFAFITKNGASTGPANPVDATTAGTYTPNKARDLFMNSGDHLRVDITDTPQGVRVTIYDLDTHQSGFMTASPANGFGQVKFDPNGSGCTEIPYAFHPMYSTSTPQTRVTWAAHSYNVAFDSEIGHFDFCNGPVPIPATQFGLDASGNPTTCPTGDTEGPAGDMEPSDPAVDDLFCFPGSEAMRYKVSGCTYTNDPGFDGASYQPLWPDGNTRLHPTPFQFSSPTTGRDYNVPYEQAALETDLPDVEFATCNRTTGVGCTLIPTTDDGTPAAFYPFFSITRSEGARNERARSVRHAAGDRRGGCVWQFGNDIPGEITDFGRNAQYGPLLKLSYTTKGGGSVQRYNDFRNILGGNPCPSGGGFER
jgi:hypothetical protein